MVPVLEAVPNFSEGRDPDVVRELVEAIRRAGADVLDWSADPDHHRSVVTFVGDPRTVEAAALAVGRRAMECIDLREHAGVHPRVGALDVLPFVPLIGLTREDAVRSARRVGAGLCELGIPVYFYGWASDPPGRVLSDIRRGGVEALWPGFPPDRTPDLVPPGWAHPGAHPTAGATCVAARSLLLAWNVFLHGVDAAGARGLAARLRETGGGFRGLRALGLELPGRGRVQISMNLEDLSDTSPLEVYAAVEREVRDLGGAVAGTEVVGMMPDRLVLPAAGDRMSLMSPSPARLLSRRLVAHVAARAHREASELLDVIRRAGDSVPGDVRVRADRLAEALTGAPTAGYD